MIALLNEIIRLIGGLFAHQDDATKALNARLDAQDAALEHIRILIEGENPPSITGIAVKEGNR